MSAIDWLNVCTSGGWLDGLRLQAFTREFEVHCRRIWRFSTGIVELIRFEMALQLVDRVLLLFSSFTNAFLKNPKYQIDLVYENSNSLICFTYSSQPSSLLVFRFSRKLHSFFNAHSQKQIYPRICIIIGLGDWLTTVNLKITQFFSEKFQFYHSHLQKYHACMIT